MPHASLPSADSLAGRLLIAGPSLSDPHFARSVVYLCAHSPDHGAMGIIVNKRVTQPNQSDLLAQLGIDSTPLSRRLDICNGGPVEFQRGFVLHSADWEGEDSMPVGADTRLTASVDVLREMASGKGPRHALLALGHAAWEAGQLEEEMIGASDWFVAPPDSSLLFGSDYAIKWRRAFQSLSLDPLTMPDVIGHA